MKSKSTALAIIADSPGTTRGEFVELEVGKEWIKIRAPWRAYTVKVIKWEDVRSDTQRMVEEYTWNYFRYTQKKATGFPNVRRPYRED